MNHKHVLDPVYALAFARSRLWVPSAMDVRTVAVIGAGVSGVSSAIHLRNAGLDVTVFERGDVAGGVWYVSQLVKLA